MKNSILILEDDQNLAKALSKNFSEYLFEVTLAASVSEVPKNISFTHAIVDLRLASGEFGMNVIELLLQRNANCRIVVLSGYGSINTAVEAIKRGAIDYVTKPAGFNTILQALEGTRYLAGADFKKQSLSQVENEYINFVLTRNNGNISRAAKDLGLHRQSLQRKLKKYP